VEYREHDGFRISEVGLGCYALSGAYGTKDVEEFKRTLRRAYELGVNFFDVAEAYGDAEQLLGEAVKPFRKEVYIATKVGICRGLKPDLSRAYIERACEESLERLQTDYIDFYQVHFDDPDTPVEGTVGALEGLTSAGKIRRYGLGHLPVERVERYFELGKVFSVMVELSAVAWEARERLLPLCRAQRRGDRLQRDRARAPHGNSRATTVRAGRHPQHRLLVPKGAVPIRAAGSGKAGRAGRALWEDAGPDGDRLGPRPAGGDLRPHRALDRGAPRRERRRERLAARPQGP